MADIIAFPERSPDQPTVLVVDDEFLIRGVLCEILKDSGFAVLAADSVPQAIDLLSRITIDAVFSDIKMPGKIDGLELARLVLDRWPGTRILLTSGFSNTTDAQVEERDGRLTVLRKPYRKADLAPRHKAMLDFAVKVAERSHAIDDKDYEELKSHGFSDDDAWDIAAIAAVFAMSNRLANAFSIRANDEFYLMGRESRS